MSKTDFFSRLAAVPGVGYSGQPDIDREKLPGANATPRTKAFSHGGKRESFVIWETTEGVSTSQSPALAHANFGRDADPSSNVLRRVYEALELPGSAADYHFALLRAYEWLRKQCRTNPDSLTEFERLCLLDVSLVQACPEAIMHGADPTPFMARVPAFAYLIRLYEREGYLADALDVARSAAACGQGTDDQDRLTKRIQELKAEDG